VKNLLIIRSVSFQQLDMNLKEIIKAFPDYNVTLLTHEHGVKLAEKYKLINEIVTYPHTKSFSYFRSVPELRDRTFDVVVVPVTNLTGAGFSNVLRFALTIKAERRILCNLVSRLEEITVLAIAFTGLKNIVFAGLAGLLTGLAIIVILPYLMIKLPRLEKKG
jgi:hypothetical protein